MHHGLFTLLLHCVGVCHYTNVYVQHTTKLSTLYQQRPCYFGSFLTAMTYLPHLPHIFLFISLTPFLSSFQRGRLTEQGSIQPEGTVSGRRNLTSCSTQSREYQLPILSYPASLKILTLCSVSVCFMLHLLHKMNCHPKYSWTSRKCN